MPEWCARIDGHKFDLDEWRELFVTLNSAKVDITKSASGDDIYILRCSDFSSVDNAVDLRRAAIPRIEELNGIAKLLRDCEPLTYKTSVRLESGGAYECHVLQAETVKFKIRGGKVTVTVGNVPVAPDEFSSSNAEKLIETAQSNDALLDLLRLVAKMDNWFDTYKCIELVHFLIGGEHEAKRIHGKNWSLAKQTANHFRHAKVPLPKNPPSLDDVRSLVVKAAKDAVRRFSSPKS